MTPNPVYSGRPHLQPTEWKEWLDKCERQAAGQLNQEEVRVKGEMYRAKILADREAKRRRRWEAAKEGRVAM